MMTETKMMLCHRCGSEMEIRTVRLVENTQSGEPVVIRNVPAKVCPQCGERVFAQPVAQALLDILTGDRPPEETVTLELPAYTVSVVVG
jgi:YgiT-type zinc finger domain-containing protein